MKRTFIISPVRNVEPLVHEAIVAHVSQLESEGYVVHLPKRDTKQDAKEVEICTQNLNAIIASDVVYIWFDPNSIGSVFDIGVTVSHNKPLVILNEVQRTEGKSFANMILDYASKFQLQETI
jgi:nucleoside 2-deoxyribosyltransferase